jgi:hydrogenase nickel incorporation protein HypA/HybF
MHEHHQVQRLVAEAQKLAEEKKAKKVKRVTILVGELLGFNEGSIRLYWEQFSAQTPVEGAELTVEFSAIKLKCPKCGKVFDKKKAEFKCPSCHVLGEITPSGNEVCIKEIIFS